MLSNQDKVRQDRCDSLSCFSGRPEGDIELRQQQELERRFLKLE